MLVRFNSQNRLITVCLYLFAAACRGIVSHNRRTDMKSEFTAVFEKRGKWYIGFVEEVPGVNT